VKRIFLLLVIAVTLLVQTAGAVAGQLQDSLTDYKVKTQEALDGEQLEPAKKYLLSCLAAADHLNDLEAGDRRVPEAFHKLVSMRLEAINGLTPQTSSAAGVRAEKDAYDAYLQPFLLDEYIGLVALQDRLLERKYFKNETTQYSNFIERYINSKWSLTRADHSDITKVLKEPHLGVSPWEAIIRLEPAATFNRGAQAAAIGTAGLSYTFFPVIDRSKTPPGFDESFWSKWLKKSGGKVGIGVGSNENRARILVGTGLQINAVVLWALYEPEGRDFMFGLSASDLGVIKKVVPWFL
jgi:hypothetical protein